MMGLRSVSASKAGTPLALEPTIVNYIKTKTRGTGESVGLKRTSFHLNRAGEKKTVAHGGEKFVFRREGNVG